MRYQFLLDDNVLYHAIRGVDRHDRPDDTSARLLITIVEVCHSLVIHQSLRVRYLRIIERLRYERPPHLEPAYLLNQLLVRADKRTLEYDELPAVPEQWRIPTEDVFLVQAALISHPLLVTADEPLHDALKAHPESGIQVFWPVEAIERAKEIPDS